jgi:hypothetical protein
LRAACESSTPREAMKYVLKTRPEEHGRHRMSWKYIIGKVVAVAVLLNRPNCTSDKACDANPGEQVTNV